jgi:hypothetical protein
MLLRYKYADPYTLEELKREYVGSDWRGRVRLLRCHLRRGDLPHEIAETALKDAHVEVRQWWARHAPLSDEGRKEMLKDPDAFVRACLWENPHCLPYANLRVDWKAAFHGCSRMERLALVRNPKVPQELVERVFDRSDTDLVIDVTERHELALAALANDALFRDLDREAGLTDGPTGDGYSRYLADRFLTTLWEKASAWPDDAAVRYLTYQHVSAFDEVKASAYQKSSTGLRAAILENCGPGDRETLGLAMDDSDELRRHQAYATVGYLTEEELHRLISGNDYMSLDAACCNRSLDVETRQKILKRLRELGHNDEPWLDDVDRELEAAEEQRQREEKAAEEWDSDADTDTVTEPELDLEAELREAETVVKDKTIIDNAVLAQRISALARRQRRSDRKLSRRLTGIEAVLARIWAYTTATPDLMLLLVAGVVASWLIWTNLPGWLGSVAVVIIAGVVIVLGGTKLDRAQVQAHKAIASQKRN